MTITEAEHLYKKFDGNLYYMNREAPLLYEDFKQLNISSKNPWMEGCEVVTGDSPNDVKENYDSVKKTNGISKRSKNGFK